MHNRAKLTTVMFLLTLSTCSATTSVHAGEPIVFPWGCNSSLAAGQSTHSSIVYRTLARAPDPRHQQVPLQPLAKPSYAYGWFGSNPSVTWGRHFGHSQNFTQWTAR
ncbi:MAG: hypothetical protein R3C53_24620 [Pirellulaceae bacterium]